MDKSDKEEIAKMIEKSIRKTVKKDICDLKEMAQGVSDEMEALTQRFDAHELKMEPISEGWDTVKRGRDFIVWIGAPLAVIGGFIAWFK